MHEVRSKLGFPAAVHRARVVQGRQAGHFHSLGRVLRAGVRQRVVPAQYVPSERAARISSTTPRPGAPTKSLATRISSPCSQAENWDPAAWVELFLRVRRHTTLCRSPSTTTVFPCTTAHSPTGTPPRWVPAGTSSLELEAEVTKAGLKFGVSSHRAFNWRFYTFARRL